MSHRKKPDSYHAAKKKRALEKLVERYYGKKDLLAAWDDHPNPDPGYIRDLKARLRTHKNDLTYRGRGVEEELETTTK
jgi:hypothetical protein